MISTTPPVHLRMGRALEEKTEKLALRAVLTAARLLGVATGTHLRHLRDSRDPLTTLQARLEEAELRAHLAWEAASLLRSRFAKIPEKHRPYFTPAARFRILEIKNLLAWNGHDTARFFLLCPNTIHNWEAAARPDSRTVGSPLDQQPPVRRAADAVHSLVQFMDSLGFGGRDLIARTLARAGWKLSARSVGRYRKEKLVAPTPSPEAPEPRRTTHPVIARFVHHTWMMDISEVKQFLGPTLHMATVFDAFSRLPLALHVFDQTPSGRDMKALLRTAARAFATPKYLITDKGGQFVESAFRKAVGRLGAKHRFASTDSILATARLERFWRTLKETASLYGLLLPLSREDLERRLELPLLYYLCFRPHEGLRGATPAEAFLGTTPAHEAAVEPPRARPGEGPAQAPFVIDYLDPAKRRFPVLKRAA
jgi:transposase InsO family protein